jgi:hypothetical protein
MLPDIDLRLQAIAKTLQDIVLPAVPAAEQQAREQIMLIIAHLAILEPQWKMALKFELGTYDGLCKLARQVQSLSGDKTLQCELDAALATSITLDRTTYEIVSREVKHLAGLLDRVISGDSTTAPLDSKLFNAVLAYSELEVWRNRVWFAASKVDPEGAELPGLDALLQNP